MRLAHDQLVDRSGGAPDTQRVMRSSELLHHHHGLDPVENTMSKSRRFLTSRFSSTATPRLPTQIACVFSRRGCRWRSCGKVGGHRRRVPVRWRDARCGRHRRDHDVIVATNHLVPHMHRKRRRRRQFRCVATQSRVAKRMRPRVEEDQIVAPGWSMSSVAPQGD